MVISIIDYGMGNLKSVLNAIEFLGFQARITNNITQIQNSEKLILPGVGAFPDAMTNIRERNLIKCLDIQVLEKHKPILGICLGAQLFAKRGYEGGINNGLGWLDAEVKKLDLSNIKLKTIHIGWNNIKYIHNSILFDNIKDNTAFYFVHGYHIECNEPESIIATTQYGTTFTVAIQKKNIFATQFHPEKSQKAGLKLLENFLKC